MSLQRIPIIYFAWNNVFPGPGLFSVQNLNQNEVNNIGGVAGFSSGQNLNQNEVNNIGGVAGLSSSHQPNIAGSIGSHTNTGEAVVMGKSYPSWRLPS